MKPARFLMIRLPLFFDDEDHSVEERREIAIGRSLLQRLLVVCFTERVEDVIRIFSARKAVNYERKDYEENARL